MIRNINLTVEPGQVTAVVGDSGAGKSTLTALLMRLYDPTSGAIYVDGFNLKELDLQTYHRYRNATYIIPRYSVIPKGT